MKIKKALTFRASSIGDCLMGKYLLENIHAKYPEARLGIIVGSRGAMIRDLLSAYPWIEIVEANRRNLSSLWRLWREWRSSDFIITQYAGKKGGKFSLMSKIVGRILVHRGGFVGFSDASSLNNILYDTLIPFSSSVAPAEHERKALLAMGFPVAEKFPQMKFLPITGILEKFKLNRPFIIIHLFAGNKGRGLSFENKKSLLNIMTKRFPKYHLVLSGGPEDKEEAIMIAKNFSATVVAGAVSLQELMNLIVKSKAIVSVDTGVAHISAQLNKPLIVMRTCLGPNWWNVGQYGISDNIKSLSNENMCTEGHVYKIHPDCLNNIDMSKVVSQLEEVIM